MSTGFVANAGIGAHYGVSPVLTGNSENNFGPTLTLTMFSPVSYRPPTFSAASRHGLTLSDAHEQTMHDIFIDRGAKVEAPA